MTRRILAVLVVISAILAGACTNKAPEGSPEATAGPMASEPDNGLRRITDPSLVCMVNDMFMGKPQIPVEVDGKTYFGCCAMCKERLAKEVGTRVAADPVTGEPVDKASAILAQRDDGAVLYFASTTNLRRYRAPR